jgi:3-dehydroquinate synthase
VEIVKTDEKEHHLRSILNYGHTFGHALETLTHYNMFTHGEAVAIGMSCAAHLGKALGFVDHEFIRRQDALLTLAGLPTQLPEISIDLLIEAMAKEKKAVNGKIHVIVPRKFGKVDKISDMDLVLLKNSLTEKQKKS